MNLWGKIVFVFSFLYIFSSVKAQDRFRYFHPDSLYETVSFLAHDSLKGRGNFTPSLTKAAAYISNQFNQAGLGYFFNLPGYHQRFIPDILNVKTGQIERWGLENIIGVLPGKSLPNEIVLITAHYDHVGVNRNFKDSIFNGANDNASGTAAMLSMMKYFSSVKNNNRTIIFVAFAGEELGLVGSNYLAARIKADSVVAMFNLEMLGKVHCDGPQTLIVTGSEFSNLDRIMKKYSKTLLFYHDFFLEEKLFTRSDNYPFAMRGIAAHTFMCFTPGDVDYHQPSDGIDKIDFYNFSHLVKGLIPGIEAVVSGKEKPKRIRK